MRKLLILLLCLLAGPVLAQQTKAGMTTEINTNYPNNTSGAITPQLLRQTSTDMVNSWQQAPSVRAVTATTDTLQLTDFGNLVSYNNSGGVAVGLAQATGSYANYNVFVKNAGTAGNVVITPAVSTINGQTSLTLAPGQSAWIVSDGTNYQLGQQSGSGLPAASGTIYYVSTAGNDSNSGLTPFAPKLTIQAAINAAGSAGNVIVGAGTYTLTVPLEMQPGVRVLCNSGAAITQGNGQNLAALVDFSGNTANGAALQGCIINGNRTGNTDSLSVFCVLTGPANDVVVQNNTIENCNGYGVDVGAGLRARITGNLVQNFYAIGIANITNAASFASYAQISGNRILAPMGNHAIGIVNADYDTIENNLVNAGTSVGAPGNLTNVSTSGTTVTWVSGTNFANVSNGQFVILNGGSEFQISAVNSPTSLTVTTTLPTLTNTPAVIGTGDLVSLVASSWLTVAHNTVIGGATDGIALSSGANGEIAQKDLIVGNQVYQSGEFCIGISQVTSNVQDNSVIGNLLTDCGQSTASDGSVANTGIDVSGSGTSDIFIDGNYVRDDQGTPTIAWWLQVGAVPAGSVIVGHNGFRGTINNGVTGDVLAGGISLSAGWGSTASVSNIVSQGDAVEFTITSAGTGQAANATATITKAIATPDNPPIMQCKSVNGTLTTFYGENDSTAGSWVVANTTTPTAGDSYTINCR